MDVLILRPERGSRSLADQVAAILPGFFARRDVGQIDLKDAVPRDELYRARTGRYRARVQDDLV